MVFHSTAELKEAYAAQLRAKGESVSVDVSLGNSLPGESINRPTIDILTDREIICCALVLDAQSVVALSSRLAYYGKYSPSWQKVIAAHKVVDSAATKLLAESGIKLVMVSSDAIALSSAIVRRSSPQSRLRPSSSPPAQKVVYRYPSLDSVEGGDGFYAAIIALTSVILAGMLGVYFSWEDTPAGGSGQSSVRKATVVKVDSPKALAV